MARPGISRNSVFEAASKLIGRGIEPTIELIRSELGTGSNSTIAGFLREWRALQEKSGAGSLNEDIPDELIGMMRGLWQRVLSQTDMMIADIKHEGEQKIDAIRNECEALKSNYVEMEYQCEQLKQKMEVLHVEKAEVDRRVIKMDKEISVLQANNHILTTQLDEKQQHMIEVRNMYKQMQENLEHFRESAREQRQADHNNYTQQIQQVELSLKNSEHLLVVANQSIDGLQKRLNQESNDNIMLRMKYDATNHEYERLKTAISSVETERDEMNRALTDLMEHSETFKSEIDSHKARLNDLMAENSIIAYKLTAAIDELEKVKDTNKLLSREKSVIALEKAQLEGQIKQMEKLIGA